MSVLMVTGNLPPSRCGVGDYTAKLVSTLLTDGEHVEVATTVTSVQEIPRATLHPIVHDWSMAGILKLARFVRERRPSIVHLQYPTIAYGRKLAISFLPMFIRLAFPHFVLTLHEFGSVNWLRKIAIAPLLLGADRIIFTNAAEQARLKRIFPWIAPRSVVIPLGSSIDVVAVSGERTADEVLYFGTLYEGKGLDTALRAVKHLQDSDTPCRFTVVGDRHPLQPHYADKMRELAGELGVEVLWLENQSAEEVSRHLQRAAVCVLPFEEGVSYKRSTFVAALLHGVPVITTIGSGTPSEILPGEHCCFSRPRDPHALATSIEQLLANKELRLKIGEGGRNLAQAFSWPEIARKTSLVYQELRDS